MHTMVHINLLGLPRPIARRAAIRIFPTDEELIPCLLIAVATLVGFLLALARIL